jgi:hypothetical protein
MARKPVQKLTERELKDMFAAPEWAIKPLLGVADAAVLAGVTPATIYDWSSRGLLDHCATRRGKRLRIHRDRFARFLMGEN